MTDWWTWWWTLPALVLAGGSAALFFLRRLHGSVGFAPPTAEMLRSEPHDQHVLFRALPQLKTKIAWRALGQFPTPVHRASLGPLRFLVKREDLSSKLYGGNKVRTLQHQLAVCEARLESDKDQSLRVTVIGSGGSNQVVATIVHSRSLPAFARRGRVLDAFWAKDDAPDLDNALNFLSGLSFASSLRRIGHWGRKMSLRSMFRLRNTLALPMGGNNPAGVLGQVNGMLELAEQVASGSAPDPDRIYVAMGSSCTISGLIIGVALARHLNGRYTAFRSDDFRIVGTIIDNNLAFVYRHFDLHGSWISQFIPMTIHHTVRTTCAALCELGLPDLTQAALHVLRTNVEIRADKDLVGLYGAHSDISRAAARDFDERGSVVDESGECATPLWLCGHFCAKPFAGMLADLQSRQHRDKVMLFWQTKSAVQPRGPDDEWAQMCAMPATVRQWAEQGKAESSLRPGSVDCVGGSAGDYRHNMTEVE